MKKRKDFSRREFLQTSAVAAGSLLAASSAKADNTILLDPHPYTTAAQSTAPSDRVRFGMIGIGMQGSGLLPQRHHACPASSASGAADLYDGRHTLAQEITSNPNSAGYAPLSGIARSQRHRLHRRRRARSLAQARGRGRLQCGQRHLLREAHVAHRRTRVRDGGSRAEKQSHRADRLAARQLGPVRQGSRAVPRAAPSAMSKWSNSVWAATIPPAPGNILRRSISRRRIWIGTPG